MGRIEKSIEIGAPPEKVCEMLAEVAFELETGKRLNHYDVGYAFEVLIASDEG
jgi:hypothetical protein